MGARFPSLGSSRLNGAWGFLRLVGLLVLLISANACAVIDGPLVTELQDGMDEIEKIAFQFGTVGRKKSAPIGYFAVLRKGSAACAVRFTGIRKSGKKSTGTVFYSGDPTTYAEYDWYYQSDGSLDFTRPNVSSGHSYVKDTASFGVGRASFKPTANIGILCGPLAVEWSYPNLIWRGYAWKEGQLFYEKDLEFAPTGTKDAGKLVFDPNILHWTIGNSSEAEFIPVEKLP